MDNIDFPGNGNYWFYRILIFTIFIEKLQYNGNEWRAAKEDDCLLNGYQLKIVKDRIESTSSSHRKEGDGSNQNVRKVSEGVSFRLKCIYDNESLGKILNFLQFFN